MLEATCEHGVVVRVRQHDKTILDQLLSRLQQLDAVGEQRDLVTDHLEFDPVCLERLPGEPGCEHSLGSGEATGSVREDAHAEPREHIEHRALRTRVDSAHCHCDERGPRSDDGALKGRHARDAAAAEDEARADPLAIDHELSRQLRSPSLSSREHLDPVPGNHRRLAPDASRHDLSVHGDGDTPAVRSDQAHHVIDRSARRQRSWHTVDQHRSDRRQ